MEAETVWLCVLLALAPSLLLCTAIVASAALRWYHGSKAAEGTVELFAPGFADKVPGDLSFDLSLWASAGEEENSPPPARAQRFFRNGSSREVWPEFWGITLEQCQQLLTECRQDPNWDDANSMHVLVRDYVIPKTKGHGTGYALLVNQSAPKEVNMMVSHAWHENAKDFVSTLARTVSKNDVMFICAFSLYQCEDEAGPSIKEQLGSQPRESPFWRVLRHIKQKGKANSLWRWNGTLRSFPRVQALYAVCLLSVPMLTHAYVPTPHGAATAKSGHWHYVHEEDSYIAACLLGFIFSAIVAGMLHIAVNARRMYNGCMVSVPNHECDLYTRLWCVYEIWVAVQMQIPIAMARTLAGCGSCSSRDAICTSIEDQLRIKNEIDHLTPTGETGYERIDKAVNKLKQTSQREALWILLTNGPMQNLCGTAAARCLWPDLDATCMLGIIAGIWVAGVSVCYFCTFLSKHAWGLLTLRGVVRAIAWLAALSVFSFIPFLIIRHYGHHGRVNDFVLGALGATSASFAQSSASLAVLALGATLCPLSARKKIREKAVLLMPCTASLVTVIFGLRTIGKDTLLFPEVLVCIYASVWVLGRLHSFLTLSVAWRVHIKS